MAKTGNHQHARREVQLEYEIRRQSRWQLPMKKFSHFLTVVALSFLPLTADATEDSVHETKNCPEGEEVTHLGTTMSMYQFVAVKYSNAVVRLNRISPNHYESIGTAFLTKVDTMVDSADRLCLRVIGESPDDMPLYEILVGEIYADGVNLSDWVIENTTAKEVTVEVESEGEWDKYYERLKSQGSIGTESNNEVTDDSDYRSAAKDLESRLFGSQQNTPESQVVEDVAEEHGVSESELKKAYNCELYDGEPAGCDQYGY